MTKRAQTLREEDPGALRDLCEWIEVHTLSLHQATHSAICHSQPSDTTEGFDCRAYYMGFKMTARPDADGDPSKLYRVDEAELRPIEELYPDKSMSGDAEGGAEEERPGKRDGSDEMRLAFLESLDDADAKHRATIPPSKLPCYVGTIACCYQVSSQQTMKVMALYHLMDDRDFFDALSKGVIRGVTNVPLPRHELWLERLQQRVELGHCFGPELSIPVKLMQGLGRMVRRRPAGKWTWTPLTREESEIHGYGYIVAGLLY